MIGFLIAIAFVVWLTRQFYGARAERWKARALALQPVLEHVAADIRAPIKDLRIEREARRYRRELG